MAVGTGMRGVMRVPGDKSISHRSIIFGSVAEGETVVRGLLEGEDVLRTMAAFRAMGVAIHQRDGGAYVIEGVGLDGLAEPDHVLDMGNSGTGMRLLTGLLASQSFFSVVTGDASLRTRPMGRVIQPLTRMGAVILGRDNNRLAPLAIRGRELLPLEHATGVASAQVKSALLLAGLNTPGVTRVTEPALSRDHTERMLTGFGARVQRDGLTVTLDGWPTLKGQTIRVPGDISSAAFFVVAGLLCPGSDLVIEGVGVNPTRTGLLELLDAMGAGLVLENNRLEGGEPVADLRVGFAELRGISVPPEVVPRAIDEFPIFFVAASLARGRTVVAGAGELRHKESDRLHAMAVGLRLLGARVEEADDGLIIEGRPDGLDGGVTVDSMTDHRVAMSLTVAALRCRKGVRILRTANIATSFPDFVQRMQGLGVDVAVSWG
ncbi:MAG: 3-phosphoshikimate 1-carboxyvinyltransferase [Magnetococcales bacterium]|nr:3-phosphoshikimate 1-carboxyvinyltransferase [Magnetococcales bacterium]MBF0149972.1 3-phosphoshikimate 1-carboxyvinyltransferase [Magnetococcales bacterium]MBF0173630.1 3-phosphoshikimate 1-carboxyvinyltransferase [Magnetococcales bacterium]MBF0347991.1 3-phosphoshikimate 1-carboxyvinyltransferase [Magnetococcales bacterium]MBF0631298.1 3-phosphoshikimate 1-carboxyvinyltransferase [Magnetococcales bacterium]